MIKTYNELEIFVTTVVNNAHVFQGFLRISREIREYASDMEVVKNITDWANGVNRPDDYLKSDDTVKTEVPLPYEKSNLTNYNALLADFDIFMQGQTGGVDRTVILAEMSRKVVSSNE